MAADRTRWLHDVTDLIKVSDGDQCIIDGGQCFTDVYPMVAEESSVANPQKVAKIDEKCVGNTALDLKQLMNYPIPHYYRWNLFNR